MIYFVVVADSIVKREILNRMSYELVSFRTIKIRTTCFYFESVFYPCFLANKLLNTANAANFRIDGFYRGSVKPLIRIVTATSERRDKSSRCVLENTKLNSNYKIVAGNTGSLVGFRFVEKQRADCTGKD